MVYGSRKRKPNNKGKDDDKSSKAATPEMQSPAVKVDELPPTESQPETPTKDSSVKDDWDAESEPEAEATTSKSQDVKSDWDASSDEENEKPVKKEQIAEVKTTPIPKGMNHNDTLLK